MNWHEYLINNIIPALILIMLIIIFAFSMKEHYVGNPISSLISWDSGNVLRRLGTQFSATNQGLSNEYMTGSKDPPSYTGPWQANNDYSADISGRTYVNKESYAGNYKMDDGQLSRSLY